MEKGAVAQLLRDTRKKDEDARLIQQGDELYLESTTNLLENSHYAPLPVENVSMMEQAAVLPVPDMRVQSIYYMFLMHHLVMLCVLVISMPIYFVGLSRLAAIICLSVSLVLFAIFYINMILWRKLYEARISVGCLIGWTLCCAVSIGSGSILLGNIALFQWVVLIWGQTLAVIVYCRLSPRIFVAFPTALLYMCGVTLLIWASSIALFVVERDWFSAIAILLFALVCCGYHVYQINKMEEYAYNSSVADVMLSIVQFYKVWPN